MHSSSRVCLLPWHSYPTLQFGVFHPPRDKLLVLLCTVHTGRDKLLQKMRSWSPWCCESALYCVAAGRGTYLESGCGLKSPNNLQSTCAGFRYTKKKRLKSKIHRLLIRTPAPGKEGLPPRLQFEKYVALVVTRNIRNNLWAIATWWQGHAFGATHRNIAHWLEKFKKRLWNKYCSKLEPRHSLNIICIVHFNMYLHNIVTGHAQGKIRSCGLFIPLSAKCLGNMRAVQFRLEILLKTS